MNIANQKQIKQLKLRIFKIFLNLKLSPLKKICHKKIVQKILLKYTKLPFYPLKISYEHIDSSLEKQLQNYSQISSSIKLQIDNSCDSLAKLCFIEKGLQQIPMTQELNYTAMDYLIKKEIKNESLILISRILRNQKQLRLLRLAFYVNCPQYCHKGLRYFSKQLSSLTHIISFSLHFTQTDFSDQRLTILVDAISKMEKLQKLQLSLTRTNLQTFDLQVLGNGISKLSKLKSIELRISYNDQIQNEGIYYFFNKISQLSYIQEIVFTVCLKDSPDINLVFDAIVIELFKFPKLKRFEMSTGILSDKKNLNFQKYTQKQFPKNSVRVKVNSIL